MGRNAFESYTESMSDSFHSTVKSPEGVSMPPDAARRIGIGHNRLCYGVLLPSNNPKLGPHRETTQSQQASHLVLSVLPVAEWTRAFRIDASVCFGDKGRTPLSSLTKFIAGFEHDIGKGRQVGKASLAHAAVNNSDFASRSFWAIARWNKFETDDGELNAALAANIKALSKAESLAQENLGGIFRPYISVKEIDKLKTSLGLENNRVSEYDDMLRQVNPRPIRFRPLVDLLRFHAASKKISRDSGASAEKDDSSEFSFVAPAPRELVFRYNAAAGLLVQQQPAQASTQSLLEMLDEDIDPVALMREENKFNGAHGCTAVGTVFPEGGFARFRFFRFMVTRERMAHVAIHYSVGADEAEGLFSEICQQFNVDEYRFQIVWHTSHVESVRAQDGASKQIEHGVFEIMIYRMPPEGEESQLFEGTSGLHLIASDVNRVVGTVHERFTKQKKRLQIYSEIIRSEFNRT